MAVEKYTPNLNLAEYGTNAASLASSVREWRLNVNGVSNSNTEKIDTWAGQVNTKNTEQDGKISALETNTTNLGTNKYDNVTYNPTTGEMTFQANGVDKKTVKSSNIILDGNVQPNMELITQDIPILIDKSYGIKVDLSGSGQGTITR
ncbi:MAG: hypothetical protein ACRCTZ_21135, partial [Sarcina sp.]